METSPSTAASPSDSKTPLLEGQLVRLFPYARGLYPRDTLYHAWKLMEAEGAGPKLFWGSTETPELHSDISAFCKYFEESTNRALVLIQHQESGALAGFAWFDDFVPQHRCFGSIFIAKAYRGRMGLEAVRMVSRYAMEAFTLQAVWAVSPWKDAQRLICAAGYQRMAVLPEFTRANGIPVDVLVYRLTKEA
jgi:RimJ/RimL family protein N-acetyltransferase